MTVRFGIDPDNGLKVGSFVGDKFSPITFLTLDSTMSQFVMTLNRLSIYYHATRFANDFVSFEMDWKRRHMPL